MRATLETGTACEAVTAEGARRARTGEPRASDDAHAGLVDMAVAIAVSRS
jgi:ligand-binding sensor protein